MDHLTRLALAARDGDVDALDRLIAETQGDVWRLCAHLGDRRDADDLTQEVFERAIAGLTRFRAEGNVRSWLFVIARRVCADHVRRAQRHRRRLDVIRAESVAGQSAGPDGATAIGGFDETLAVDIDDLLSRLDDDRRAAFVLTQLIGLHYDEAAEVLECPIGTIRSRVARARRDLLAMSAQTPIEHTDHVGEARSRPTGTAGPNEVT